MIGDRLVFQEIHYKKKSIIVPQIIKKYFHQRMVIALGEQSGTGKTEVASLIQEELFNKAKVRARIVHVDDFYRTT